METLATALFVLVFGPTFILLGFALAALMTLALLIMIAS